MIFGHIDTNLCIFIIVSDQQTNKPIISLDSGTYSSVVNVFFCYDLPNTERTPLRLTTKMFTIEFIVLNVDYIIVNKLFEVIESN